MTVIFSEKDYDTLTMTLVAEFDASIDRVWQLWSDPRQLERWWGPPSHPATFHRHELSPGGTVTFKMTGANGDIHRGWWEVISIDPPKELQFLDGFADADGNNVESHPVSTVHVSLSESEGTTTMKLLSIYPSLEGFEEMAGMGMEEGWRLCVGQMDGVLLGEAASAR